MPDYSRRNGDFFFFQKRRKETSFISQGTSAHSPPSVLPSGCHWQPGNHIFLVPDIIIIINIVEYLSHLLGFKELKAFHIILSALTWGRRRRRCAAAGGVGQDGTDASI